MNDKQQLAAMGEHLAEQQPMCMAKRIEELEPGEPDGGTILRDPVGRRKSIHRSDAERAMFGVHIPDPVGSLDEIPAPAVPEGWQMVPRMPTPEMCAAFHKADADWEDGWAFDDNGNRHDSPVYQWVAMLSAAPSPDGTK